jgi:hypothetical protein
MGMRPASVSTPRASSTLRGIGAELAIPAGQTRDSDARKNRLQVAKAFRFMVPPFLFLATRFSRERPDVFLG